MNIWYFAVFCHHIDAVEKGVTFLAHPVDVVCIVLAKQTVHRALAHLTCTVEYIALQRLTKIHSIPAQKRVYTGTVLSTRKGKI